VYWDGPEHLNSQLSFQRVKMVVIVVTPVHCVEARTCSISSSSCSIPASSRFYPSTWWAQLAPSEK